MKIHSATDGANSIKKRLSGRMKTFEIMKLTGHRSEQNFFRYIRLTGDDTARSISGDMFFRK